MNRFLFLLFFLPSISIGYEFYSGEKVYSTKTVSKQLSDEDEYTFQITTILVAACNENHPLFKEQWEQFENLDAEQLQLIYVSASKNSENKHGYYTRLNTAKAILDGSEFRVLVISPEGVELKNSEDVLKSDEIKNTIKR